MAFVDCLFLMIGTDGILSLIHIFPLHSPRVADRTICFPFTSTTRLNVPFFHFFRLPIICLLYTSIVLGFTALNSKLFYCFAKFILVGENLTHIVRCLLLYHKISRPFQQRHLTRILLTTAISHCTDVYKRQPLCNQRFLYRNLT